MKDWENVTVSLVCDELHAVVWSGSVVSAVIQSAVRQGARGGFPIGTG